MIVYGVMIDGAVLEHDDTRYLYPNLNYHIVKQGWKKPRV